MQKIQFPSLNGLRFLAAFGVIVHHIEQAKYLYKMPNLWMDPTIGKLGGHCVSLFFVLSGFLITFLLMEEKKVFQTISIRKFYIRRALRIWPLYFIIVILGFLVLPALSQFNVPTYPPVWDKHVGLKALLYTFFSPQFAAVWLAPVAYAGVLWSVGVEEWFYAVWPWVVKLTRRWEFLFLVAAIVSLTVVRANVPQYSHADFLFRQLRFDCMAVGGLFAMLLQAKGSPLCKRILDTLYRTDVQLFVYVLLAVSMMKDWAFDPVSQPVYSLLFGAVILNLATNEKSIMSLETPVLNWLGNISYGLYCYNWITIVAALLIVRAVLPGLNPPMECVCLSLLGIGLTVLVSGLSYELIERRFLLLKQRAFTVIETIAPTSIQPGREPELAYVAESREQEIMEEQRKSRHYESASVK